MTLSSSHTKASRAHKALPATFTVPRSLEEGGEEKSLAGEGASPELSSGLAVGWTPKKALAKTLFSTRH